MAYRYTHFIPQNIAPIGAKRIGVYDSNGNRVCGIELGKLSQPNKKPLYSFGLVSDIHLYKVNPTWDGNNKFDRALTYLENLKDKNCIFCAHCGDITQTGLYSEGDKVNLAPEQFAKYKEIRYKHTIPVYGICGNHESYVRPITDNLDKLEYYTGTPLTYTISSASSSEETVGTTVRPNVYAPVRDDLFIMISQSSWFTSIAPMSDSDFYWLQNVLNNNKNRRCFIFIHSYIEEDSGDPKDVRENSMFDTWNKTAEFMELLSNNPNVILFHGHSHMKLENQQYYDSSKPLDKDQLSYKNANYTHINGFKSVHVPSLATPRDINFSENESKDDNLASEGYIVDVYDDCIVLNGLSFSGTNATPVPLGTYKIYTTLQTVESDTLVNDDGILSLSGKAFTVDSDGIIDLRRQNYEY